MGLVSDILGFGARLLGVGGTQTAVGTGRMLAQRAVVGARALAPSIAGGAAGAAAFDVAGRLISPAQGLPPVARADLAVAGPQFVTLDDGSRVLVTARGAVPRPQFFLAAGVKLPSGATIVSISPDGLLFGIRRARRKKPSFSAEIDRCVNTVKGADRLLAAVRKKR